MKVIITGSVPTSYQFRSINSIGLPVHQSGNGGYFIKEIFPTKKEAIKHLRKVADYLNQDGDHAELRNNYLSYDAVTVTIEKLNK